MNTRKERLIQWLLAGISTLSILSMAGIVLFLLLPSAFPGFRTCPAEHSRQKGTCLRRGEPGVHIVYGLCNA